jgi:hypothetical protein
MMLVFAAMRSMLLIAAISLGSADAYAFDFRIGGELGLYHNDRQLSAITGLTQVIDVDMSFGSFALAGGVPFAETVVAGRAEFRFGNPWVLAYYQSKGDTLTLRIGGGAAFPAAQLELGDESEGYALYQIALGMYGLQAPWMYTPETIPLMIPSLRIDIELGAISIDLAGDVVLFVPFNSGDGQPFELALPLSAGMMVHVSFFGFGARVGAAVLPTGTQANEDKIQLSLSPRLTAAAGPIELEARLTMNLDDPYGFAFAAHGVYAVFLGAHIEF